MDVSGVHHVSASFVREERISAIFWIGGWVSLLTNLQAFGSMKKISACNRIRKRPHIAIHI